MVLFGIALVLRKSNSSKYLSLQAKNADDHFWCVAGSVALLFAGLGLSSSMAGIGNRQYGEIIKYDAVISQNIISNLMSKQQSVSYWQIKNSQETRYLSGRTYQKIQGAKDEQSLALFVTTGKNFHHFMELNESRSKSKLMLSLRMERSFLRN